MKKILLLIYVSILVFTVLSPELWAQRLRSGDNLARNSGWYSAIPKLQKQYRKSDKSPQIASKIAECYMNFANYDSAASWYSRMQPGILNDSTASKNYVRCLLAQGSYSKARILISEYLKNYPHSVDSKILLKSCDSPYLFPDKTALVFLDNPKSNSRNNDFSPVIWKGKLQYSSSRKLASNYYDGDGKPFIKLYEAKGGMEPDWLRKSKEITIKNTTKYHLGPFAYDTSGKMLLTANGDGSQPAARYTTNMALLNIYYAEKKEGSNSFSVIKPFEHNLEKYSTGHPTISPNGKYLFFVSDRSGSIGGTDLYLCTKQESTWSEPSNLGPGINTAGNEMFPTFQSDSVLYFSTNGRAGFGGLDIFKAAFRDGSLSNVENVGKPFNSPRDDFGLIYTASDEGFLTSNRKGGKGADDIYHFKSNIIKVHLIVINATNNKKVDGALVRLVSENAVLSTQKTDSAGHTLLEVLTTKPLRINGTKPGLRPGHLNVLLDYHRTRDTTLYLYLYQGATSIISGYVMDGKYKVLDQATVLMTDTTTGDAQLAETKADGFFEFVVEPSSTIKLAGSKPGYFTDKRDVPPVKAGDDLKNQNLILRQVQLNKTLEIEPIYYDFDKWDLRPESIEILDRLYDIMTENPTIMIEIVSHTDIRGKGPYNLRLSGRRAIIVYDYLFRKGISGDRLSYSGFGEIDPKSGCDVEADCPEKEHQIDRRTDFRIVSY